MFAFRIIVKNSKFKLHLSISELPISVVSEAALIAIILSGHGNRQPNVDIPQETLHVRSLERVSGTLIVLTPSVLTHKLSF